ncbi:response regulator [Arenibacter sp. 6A1]|uniref:response regulator n=1 Tax=Arenibacter sp. 6A1 TaxID=2720391 RepID=UPI00144766CF|nr:response regulator [Arenibacter sp. 6A1]NKI28215.1 response regulator [Arenibacter sp. 6A1]
MRRKVVIIENDKVICFLHTKICKKLGYEEPVVFYDGYDALQYLREQPEKSIDFLILLNIHMPLMNAWEFLENLPVKYNKYNTFIAIISSSLSNDDRIKAKQYELVQKYFVKPFTIAQASQLTNEIALREL